MKKTFFTEIAYLIGIIFLAFGTAMTAKADYGVSMVVAPAYLLNLKLSEYWSFMSFGIAEYMFQALMLLVTVIVLRKFRVSYLFSFITAIFYGLCLDLSMLVMNYIPLSNIPIRIIFYIGGVLLCALGISFLFHTYIAPEVYEMFVKEVSKKYKFDINKTKTVYDCTSLVVAILMSMLFFGLWPWKGIGVGTIITAFLNGFIIKMFSKCLEHFFEFKDGLKFRSFFEKEETEKTEKEENSLEETKN